MAVSVKLDDDLHKRVKALAEGKQRSAHWIMREAIRGYVEREEARVSFIADADDGLRDYRETGLHLTQQDIENWLLSWGRDDEQAPPKCRG